MTSSTVIAVASSPAQRGGSTVSTKYSAMPAPKNTGSHRMRRSPSAATVSFSARNGRSARREAARQPSAGTARSTMPPRFSRVARLNHYPLARQIAKDLYEAAGKGWDEG